MTDENHSHAPLQGNPARQAVSSVRGYDYQIWRTIERWLRLKPDETLFIECAEDFDVVSTNETLAVQVKDTDAKLSLASKCAKDAILHFWELRQQSPKLVRFQFLTRAQIATEQGAYFDRRPGIEVWRDAARGNSKSCDLLRRFLLEHFEDNSDFVAYLHRLDSNALTAEFFARFEWITDEPDAAAIQHFIRRRLVSHGEKNGRSPTVSVEVMADLHMYCWEVAKRPSAASRSLTREDFLLLFDNQTSTRIPIDALGRAILPGLTSERPFALAGRVRYWTDGIPELPVPTLPRGTAVATALGSLSESAILVLAGTAGKGKSTLAKLVALAMRKECIWIDFAGREESFVEAALSTAALELEDRASSHLVVIDDFAADSDTTQPIWTSFSMLRSACMECESHLLITTKGIPRERFDARFIASAVVIQQIDDLTCDEIAEFMKRLGCPSEIAKTWAQLTLVQTGGHPKLVHVRALDLRDQRWPKPTMQDLSETPESIAAQRINERLNVTKRESGPTLDFLYHLTLIGVPFDRTLALGLGEQIAGLSDPGSTLDGFLGRWIEPFFKSQYRVTSLLSNEASNAWPPYRLQEAHGRIFDAYFETQEVDVSHVLHIFLHAFKSKSGYRVSRFANVLVVAKEPHFPEIAKELAPVTWFGRGVGNRAFEPHVHASLFVRLLQFRVATREQPDELVRIAEEWRWELENLPQDDLSRNDDYAQLSALLWALNVAINIDGAFPPLMVVGAIKIVDAQSATQRSIVLPSDMCAITGSGDVVTVLFSFFQARCRSSEYLNSLLDTLEGVDDGIRQRMLVASELPFFESAGFLVDGIWIGEAKKQDPDWMSVVRVLKRTQSLAEQWGSFRLECGAAKALSIVYDEYLNDRNAAVAILSEQSERYGNSPLLRAQLGNVRFRHNEFQSALELWLQTLATDTCNAGDRLKDPFAFRKAAIAAGEIGRYDKSAELFLSGSHWAIEQGLERVATGLLFDAAYSFFKANNCGRMCHSIASGLKGILGRPDPETDFSLFAMQKLVGHVILWLKIEVTGTTEENRQVEPSLGCCSNPDYNLNLKQLPHSPPEITIVHAVEIEHRLEIGVVTLEDFRPLLKASGIPVVEMILASIELEQVYRQKRFHDLLAPLDGMTRGLERARAQHRLQQNVAQVFLGQVAPEDLAQLRAENFLLCALTAHILLGGHQDDLIGSWRRGAASLDSVVYLKAIDNLTAAVDISAENPEYVFKSKLNDTFMRVVAAHMIIISPPRTPELSAAAGAAYLTWLCQTDAKNVLAEVLPILSASFSNTWRTHLAQPALLVNPRLTISMLQEALEHRPDGARKIRLILDAAAISTRVPLQRELQEWLASVDAMRRARHGYCGERTA